MLAYFFYMMHLEAENGKEQIYFHRDNTLTECVICVKKCELEQMITNFLIWIIFNIIDLFSGNEAGRTKRESTAQL